MSTEGRMHDALTDLAASEPIPSDPDGRARVKAHADEARRRLAEAGEATQGGEERCASSEALRDGGARGEGS